MFKNISNNQMFTSRLTTKNRMHAILRNRQSISSNLNDYTDIFTEQVKPSTVYQIDVAIPLIYKVLDLYKKMKTFNLH